MIDIFEKEAATFKKFSKAFTGSCQKISNAQVMMISATQELSYYLRLFGQQNFSLNPSTESKNMDEKNENPTLSILNQFANYIDEVIFFLYLCHSASSLNNTSINHRFRLAFKYL